MINPDALLAVQQSDLTGESLADLFDEMAAKLDADDEGGMLVLTYAHKTPAIGELVPTLTLTLKKYRGPGC